jgi:hypothetical protein
VYVSEVDCKRRHCYRSEVIQQQQYLLSLKSEAREQNLLIVKEVALNEAERVITKISQRKTGGAREKSTKKSGKCKKKTYHVRVPDLTRSSGKM